MASGKTLNIANYQGHAIQNHNETVPSHLSGWLLSKRQEVTNADEDGEKTEPLCTVGGNGNWFSRYGKQYGSSSRN